MLLAEKYRENKIIFPNFSAATFVTKLSERCLHCYQNEKKRSELRRGKRLAANVFAGIVPSWVL